MTSKMSVVVGCGLAVALSMPAVSAQEPSAYSGIVVFGTSLSDPGNAFALRGGTNTPPDYQVDPLLIPGIPFARGGHHFSDGATWVEQLGRSMGLAASVRPAYRSDGARATNYAVGSARAREAGETVDLGEQVAAFLSDHGGVAPSDALYVIEMGSSDVRDAIVAYQSSGPAAAQAILQQAIGSIAQSMQLLYQSGAQHFLVWLPPNVALTPAIRQLAQANPAVTTLATFLTAGFNSGLSGVLNGLSGLPRMVITRFDADGLLNAITADPGSFGLTNVTAACITPSAAPYVCDSPDEYLFWDGIHPTRAGHALAAHEAARLLGR